MMQLKRSVSGLTRRGHASVRLGRLGSVIEPRVALGSESWVGGTKIRVPEGRSIVFEGEAFDFDSIAFVV